MSTERTTPRLAVGVEEATRIAGVGRTLIYQEIGAGRLRLRKAGRRTLIPLNELNAWLNSLPNPREDQQ